jgi:SAM-dependent methyltransferase
MFGNGRMLSVSDPEYWERLYKSGKVPWEIGSPVPSLPTFLESPYAVPKGKILVLGCGTGQDCMAFAERGFHVTGIDFATTAIQTTYQQYVEAGIAGSNGFLLQRDLFDIHEYDGYFDYVFEHNCFNSIAPHRRRTYVRTVRDLLKPDGKLIAVWWLFERGGGPPFALSRDELFQLFSDHFTFELTFTPSNSPAGRQDKELFCVMRRRG